MLFDSNLIIHLIMLKKPINQYQEASAISKTKVFPIPGKQLNNLALDGIKGFQIELNLKTRKVCIPTLECISERVTFDTPKASMNFTKPLESHQSPKKSSRDSFKYSEHRIKSSHQRLTSCKISTSLPESFIPISTKSTTESQSSMSTPKAQSVNSGKIQPPAARTKKNSRTLGKICVKEASRNPEWLSKAKPELEKMWRNIINNSNGIRVPQTNTCQYKYYVGKGNNSRLIKRALKNRSWWCEVNNPNEADFVWTQWKNKVLLSSFPQGDTIIHMKKCTIPAPSLCPVNFKHKNNEFKTVDIEKLGFQYIRNSSSYMRIETLDWKESPIKMHNRIEFNQHLTNKKGLYLSMVNYYKAIKSNPFANIPLTFHIQNGENDTEFDKFVNAFKELELEKANGNCQNLWILKPGENSNRGHGISVCENLDQITNVLNGNNNENRTFILQKYLEKPFLIHKRKFDFRCYSMITSINGVLQGYFYADGYIRTASCEFSIKDPTNNFMHLTNDAIQKHCDDYGKFEDGNKLSYKDFQRYLDFYCSDKKLNFFQDILPQIKSLTNDTMKACFFNLDPKRRLHTMEIFGYDFMLDANGKVWLIEINTNPCLELASGYLSRLIPSMVENAFRIALDPLFPPPLGKSCEVLIDNKFELIFNQAKDADEMIEALGDRVAYLQEERQVSEGEEIFSDEEV